VSILRPVPTFAHPVWGGERLARAWGKGSGRVGESWEAWPESRLPDGRRLGDICVFPLLIKLLDTVATLSVQVHPDDAQAQALRGSPTGKEEGWVVLNAEPGARVAHGLSRRMSKEDLRERALSGRIEADLAWVPVRAGDVIDVPPGTIHAISGGVTLYEVQQPADLTFRLYDWGRGRTLHLDEAIAVARLEPRPVRARRRQVGPGRTLLLEGEHFRVEERRLPALVDGTAAITTLRGEATVQGDRLRVGQTAVAAGGSTLIEGEGAVIVAWPR
jgi:mannose-6-phosphate isomerase